MENIVKKRILSAMLLTAITTTGAIASEVKSVDLRSDYKNTKELMNDAKKNLPKVHEVITDYFQAKTCKEDITSIASIKDIREFATSYQYGVLIGFKYQAQESIVARTNYDALINAYKVMNCGSDDAMGVYVGAVSAMAVEMNANQTK